MNRTGYGVYADEDARELFSVLSEKWKLSRRGEWKQRCRVGIDDAGR